MTQYYWVIKINKKVYTVGFLIRILISVCVCVYIRIIK